MRTHFTADTHFGHARVIGLCDRPYADIEAHDEGLIAAWNAVVAPEDTVWHLGDFAFRCRPERVRSIFARLNGIKHLVRGNHDSTDTDRFGWATVGDLRQVVVEGERLVLCHYGLRVWPGSWRGAIHLYGHSHGRLPGVGLSTDVGVDCWGYAPVALAQIRARLALQEPYQPEARPETADEPGYGA